MSRQITLNQTVETVPARRLRIESEPLPANIAALLDEAVASAGEKTLWNFFESEEQISYREAQRHVHGLARSLSAIGIRKGTHVAVMLPNVAAFPLTWLAIGTIGAVMVPVNVGYQPRELAYVLKDSEAEYVVVDHTCLALLEGCIEKDALPLASDRIVVHGGTAGRHHDWHALARPAAGEFVPPEPVGLDDLLNIQYTSGTTGFPKGCMLTQRYWLTAGKVNACRDGRRFERILASTPFYYMDPQWLLLMTVFQRATLFVAARQSTSRFVQWLRAFEIQFCLFPFLVFKQPPAPDDALTHLVRGNVYGVPKDVHARIEERFDFCAREAFGMTELGSAMFMPIEATDMVGSGSCGVPSPFRECEIVDPAGRQVPVGEVGELRVRGPGILVGYYNRPEASAAALRDGWFHTGDLFRQDKRGYFYIVGRQKDMIRRSSENIAAREVESVLNGIPAVMESAAVPVPDETRGEEVKAYIVLKNADAPKDEIISEIVATCQAQLARFKVPRYFSFREVLPKTPSLKVAKQSLLVSAREATEPTYDRVAGCWLGSTQEAAR
ncbi:MAG: AMP-binding protein [Variovorax sp.]|nr:MAG: AMP-binding protein [Variovorax sp.]